jgi:hypothetical protein
MATITLDVVPFHAYAIFICILEVVFCEGVQHCLQLFLDHLNCKKWRPFSFIFNRGNREKLGEWGMSHSLVKYEVWDTALS